MKQDCHIHMVLDGVFWRDAIARHASGVDRAYVRQILERYQTAGYTYLRDGGDRWGVGAYARQIAPEYGITYRTPLAPLHKNGHYGGFIGQGFDDLRDYAAMVKRHKEDGADFIKIMISGLMDFHRYGVLTEPGLSREEICQMIRIAHDAGLSVMAHANGAETVEAAAAFGVDSVEHGAYLDREALQAMAENQVVWVPTLSTVGSLRGKGRFPEEAVEKILGNTMENVSAFAEMGGLIALGTDAGAWSVAHGWDTEQTLLAQAGVSQSQIEQGNRQIRGKF